MRIRSFPTAMDEKYVQTIWDLLKRAIVEIQKKNNSGLSFEELYRNAYTMVLHKHGDKLYQGLNDVVTAHLRSTVRIQVEEAINDQFLTALNKAWTEHTTAMVMIRDILMYMDRVYVQQSSVEPVYQLGLHLFRQEVVDYQPINEHLKCTLLGMISQERNGEIIEWINVKNACQMLLDLGIDNRQYYEQQFEELFLRESAEFYRGASQKFLSENSASVYVHKVNGCLQEESQRAERYLNKPTEEKIVKVLNDELIRKNLDTIVDMENSGLVYMLVHDKIGELREMYDLLKRVPEGPKKMIERMSSHLREKGSALVQDNTQGEANAAGGQQNPVTFVQHNGRKIALNPCLGFADVKAVFYGSGGVAGGGAKEEPFSELEEGSDPVPGPSSAAARGREEHKILTVSTYQMCILMRFNVRSRFTFEQLLSDTQVPEKDLKRSLQSLAMGKATQRVLCRRGNGKDIENTDEFWVNDGFSSKLTRIKIQMVSGRGETEPERRETRTKVDDDRKHEIEAAVVRVMKARKKLHHNDLITEVTNQLKGRFLPDPTFIKKRIESLIEREYLERDKDDHRKYNYLA
ncbi:cullin-3-like protein [Aphelenchoides avenae]|nr:cullin-3-like protein [Aphelenchus avenae]